MPRIHRDAWVRCHLCAIAAAHVRCAGALEGIDKAVLYVWLRFNLERKSPAVQSPAKPPALMTAALLLVDDSLDV